MNVYIKKCNEYDFNLVKEKVNELFTELNLLEKINENTNVFVKLNLVGPFEPNLGITTHPVVLKAVLDILKHKTNHIIIGDNPATRDQIFTMKKCGIYDVIKEYDCEILDGKVFTRITNSNYKMYSEFEVSSEMVNCDVLINLPKLKTHSLAYMTVAEKNLFGTIYGLNKSAWHVKANNPLHFGNAMNDLYSAILNTLQKNNSKIINICDGILGLEGEGPSTGGFPKKANIILASLDAVSLDKIACKITQLDDEKLFITNIAGERELGISDINKIEIVGENINDCFVPFIAPKDSLSSIGLRILKFKLFRNLLLEHPIIDTNKCIKCGECVRICPPKTMQMNKSFPHLKQTNCIRCWCCQEVCPQNAIEQSNPPLIGKLILKRK